jgi:hypothetical protein
MLPAARETAWLPQVDEEVVELLFALGVFLHVLGVTAPRRPPDRDGA